MEGHFPQELERIKAKSGGPRLDSESLLSAIENPLHKLRTADGAYEEEFKSWFKGSVVATKDGEPLVMWHATTAEYEVFDEDEKDAASAVESEAGFHFGTKTAALNRPAIENRRLFSVVLSMKKPLRIPDVIAFVPGNPDFVKAVKKAVFDDIQDRAENELWDEDELERAQKVFVKKFKNVIETDDVKKVRGFLEKQGYDGFVYENDREEGGRKGFDSVMVFHADQIRFADTGLPAWKEKRERKAA